MLNITNHAFGNHKHYQKPYCGYLKRPESYRHGNLRGEGFKKDISDLFKVYAENAKKLVPFGSTQANESFNNMVATKAPKSRHYFGSESLCFRVGVAVCVKNIGQNYLLEVFERAGIPEIVTKETKTRLVKAANNFAICFYHFLPYTPPGAILNIFPPIKRNSPD